MNFLVTLNQMNESFEAVMLSLKNQIDMHYDEVRKIAKKAEETFDNFDAAVTAASEKAANEASQKAVAEINEEFNEIVREFNSIYGTANVFATAVLTE